MIVRSIDRAMLTDVKESQARSLPFSTLSYQYSEWHDQRLPSSTYGKPSQPDSECQTDNSLELYLMDQQHVQSSLQIENLRSTL